MTSYIKLPRLDIAWNNFPSSVVTSRNRIFAVYQVDTSKNPFWVVEMTGCPNPQPAKQVMKYASHADAILCMASMARSALLGCEIDYPIMTG
jgi:hypothetical protein